MWFSVGSERWGKAATVLIIRREDEMNLKGSLILESFGLKQNFPSDAAGIGKYGINSSYSASILRSFVPV